MWLDGVLSGALEDTTLAGGATAATFAQRVRTKIPYNAIDPDELDAAVSDYWASFGA